MKKSSLTWLRIFFILGCIAMTLTYTMSSEAVITQLVMIRAGLLSLALIGSLLGLELLFKKNHLRSFNTALLGLFLGYLMAWMLIALFETFTAHFSLSEEVSGSVKIALVLFCSYIGVILTLRASGELHLSIPFVKFTPTDQKTKKIIIDLTSLSDGRLIDLAASGLVDDRLIMPRFLLNELHNQEKSPDESIKNQARTAFTTLNKLETLENLRMQYHDHDFPDEKCPHNKVIRLARFLGADMLSGDISLLHQQSICEVRMINIHQLSNALKPLMQRGEYLNIKVQRCGKEERQGVGYLEDGTMVVINGGGDFIGETIKSRVLSVKHSSTGRMIFCNLAEYEE